MFEHEWNSNNFEHANKIISIIKFHQKPTEQKKTSDEKKLLI